MARYVIRASNEHGPVEFQERLTIEQALAKVEELRDAHFKHITLYDVLTGVEITDLEALQEHDDAQRAWGEKRPADAVGRAIMVAKIATGEVEDGRELSSAAAELGRKGGKKRAANMTPERRREIAKSAAKARWKDRSA